MATTPARHKVYVEGPHGARVPFTQVDLTDGSSVRLYDTSGPGSEPADGLPPLRRDWILARDDVEEHDGRVPTARDDGRAAARRGANGNGNGAVHGGPIVLRAKPGKIVTQLHYARRGEITPEMEFVAL